LYKAGTVKEIQQIREDAPNLPEGVYHEALRIVTTLDEVYGPDRDVDHSDGGFVLIAENVQDIELINRQYMRLGDNRHEVVDVFKCESGVHINAFFLLNNEFGINVLMPSNIAPHALLEDLPKKKRPKISDS
jgi:hypothetical protein